MTKIDSFISCEDPLFYRLRCVNGVFYVVYVNKSTNTFCSKALKIKTLDVLAAKEFNLFLKEHGLCWRFPSENHSQVLSFQDFDEAFSKGVTYDLSKNTVSAFEFSWPSKKTQPPKLFVMQGGKHFYILESNENGGNECCEFYCVENNALANTMEYKEMFEIQLRESSSVLNLISISE